MENNSRNNMPIDHLKKGDWWAYKESIGGLNSSLYSKVKEEVKFLRIVDGYLLSSKSIDKCLGNAILLCIFSVLLFIAYKLSLSNLQTLLFVHVPSALLIQLSLSYVFLKKDCSIKSLHALIFLPIFVLYKICEHFLFLAFILSIKNFKEIRKFLFISFAKAAVVPTIAYASICMFCYSFQDIEFDDLLTAKLVVLTVFSVTSVICTIALNICEDDFNKLIISKILIFFISFLCCIGMFKCIAEPDQLLFSVHSTFTIIVIVACDSFYEIFK